MIFKENKNNKRDEEKENKEFFEEIKKELYENSYITSITVDIVSSIINNIIIEKKIKGKIMQVIDALESNNFITTLISLDKNVSNQSFASKENLSKMMEKFLNITEIKEIQKKAEFKTNYLIPGFFPFYDNISKFINKKISDLFSKNEKRLRDCLKGNIIKLKNSFLLEETRLLDKVREEIKIDESDNYKFINEVIEKCPSDLLLNDYISYFLDKNYDINNTYLNRTIEELSEIDNNSSNNCNIEEEIEENYIDDFYLKIIKLIIDLKYKEDSKIIINNSDNEFNKFLIKIIWLEANKNNILTVIQIINEAKNRIYINNKENILLEQLNNLIKSKKIKYITDENRNPEHTREVNECYYIIIGALFMAITDLEIILLYDPNNYKDYVGAKDNQFKVKINNYLECLKSIEKISQPFNDMLYLFSNELYIIVELNSIINLFKEQKNDYIDVQVIENITKNLRENIDIFRENKLGNKDNIENLMNLISENIQNKNKNYYSLIRKILLQEIKKVKDKNFRLDLFKSYIINEKEILINSNDIFELLLKGNIATSKGKLLTSIEKFDSRGEEILLTLENKIKDKKNEYLSQILLYYFEKLSHIYLDNYFKSKIEKKDDKNLLEKEPLDVFIKCFDLLSKYTLNKSKIKNVANLLYIGYIRVFLYKFEEYIRIKSEKLINVKKIIESINSLKNPIAFIIELYFYKVIYNKNNKDKNIFTTQKDLYNLESLNNYKDLMSLENNDDSFEEETEDKDVKENYFINLLNEKVNTVKKSKEEYPFNNYFYYSDYIDEKYLTEIIKNKDKDYPVLAKYLELKENGNLLNDFYIYNCALNSLNEEYSTKITREYATKETLDKQLIYKENKDLFNKFIEIYNKLAENNENDNDNFDDDENDNKINMNLNSELYLFKFFIFDENEFSENYKKIYNRFIDKHNKIVEKLLDSKSINLDVQNHIKDKINIQKITKEDEIFVIKNDFSLHNILFNNSYRKVLINDDFSEFNKYEINLNYIEEILSDKLLKNKRLIDDEIFEFKYKNEDLEFKYKDICTQFKNKINEEKLNIDDKIMLFEYFEENKGNVNLHVKFLDDFAELINYLIQNLDKIDMQQTKINTLLSNLEFVSNDFREFFKEKNNFTINKLLNIYEYYQILCFNKIKEKLKSYQEKIIDDEQKIKINDYKNEVKTNEKINNIIEIALRKFILCFLSKVNDKDNKIKLNNNNIKNYLEIEDLWNKDFYKKDEFYEELKKLNRLSIKINNVIIFYEKCFNNTYKDYFYDVKNELKNRKEEMLRKEREKEKEDLSNFNPKEEEIDAQKDFEENKIENNDNNNYNENEKNNNDGNVDENIDDNGDSLIDEGEEDDNNDDDNRY